MSHRKSDPKTGQYFRESSIESAASALRRLQLNSEVELEEKPPESTNVPQYLRARELGPIGGVPGKKQFFKMKISSKELLLTEFLGPRYKLSSVEFIKGGESSVFGTWYSASTNRYIVGETPFISFKPTELMKFDISRDLPVDIFEGPIVGRYETIGCINNYCYPNQGSFVLRMKQHSKLARLLYPNCEQIVLSSSTGVKGRTYIFGTESSVRVYNGPRCDQSYFVEEKCRCVCFDKTRNLVAAGLDSGVTRIYDLRAGQRVTDINISNNCLMDACFINSRLLLISSVPNTLVAVDISEKKVINEYFDHKVPFKKTPFSITEHLVCATGADNRVRIWHLSGGYPMKVLKPTYAPENNIRAWLHADKNKTYLYWFEGCYNKIYEI